MTRYYDKFSIFFSELSSIYSLLYLAPVPDNHRNVKNHEKIDNLLCIKVIHYNEQP